jgi:hypothetical protein
MNKFLTLIFVCILLSFSCSKKKEVVELKYTLEEFDILAHESKLSHEKGDEVLKFSDYSAGVNGLVYNRLVYFAISFDSVEEAKMEALRLKQYYSRNWLFDRVEGEPVLEDYVIKTFHAINPSRKIQRSPKIKSAGHGEGHEAPHADATAPAKH